MIYHKNTNIRYRFKIVIRYIMKPMEKKNGFSSGIGFILATAGGSVGLGNLCSFPSKTQENGGAAFVFVYIISVILLGLVLSIAEIFLGRRAKANNVTAYQKVRKGLGWVGLVAMMGAISIAFYYVVIGGFTVKYTLNSFATTPTELNAFAGNVGEVILYSAIFLILAIVIISAGVKKGIEKASIILMPTLIVILIGIVIYCLCLGAGVGDGLSFYLKPDFSKLGAKGILSAMSQAFFSLSIGCGALLTYGSYTGKEVNIGKSVIWIAFFDTFVALLAGFIIFPAIYHYQAVTGETLQSEGLFLLFQSMPLVFNTLGAGGQVLSFLFFGMVSIAAITSLISLVEVVAQYAIQRFRFSRKKACIFIALITLLVSIPIGISIGNEMNGRPALVFDGNSLSDVFDRIVTSVLIPVGALFVSLCFGWFIYKPENKKDLFNFKYLGRKFQEEGLNLGKANYVFAFMIKYIAPILILIIDIVGLLDNIFPNGTSGRTFSLSGLIIILIGIAIVAILIGIYFLFLKNKDNGTNEDEILEAS